MGDIKKTQHFTENYKDILFNINFFPNEAIDPFAGNCDLVKYSPNTKWELYDIDVKNDIVKYNDSLLNPIDYTDKTVITNPPYLASNKTDEFKEIFKKYNTDDLYKAAILSIIGCKNGILIIPINFFTDEKTSSIREIFLSKYKVNYVNYFTKQMFANTTYNVCSFYFEQGETNEVDFFDFEKKTSFKTNLKKEFGYRLGGEFYDLFKNVKPLFDRVQTGKEKYITNIFFNALDTRAKRLNLSYNENTYIGKISDRIFGTLYCKEFLSKERQLKLINDFNCFINFYRDKYNNLVLTNYRDNGRKRISLENIYKICTYLLDQK